MSDRFAPGAFDTTYFPEIEGSSSSYTSPLEVINQKLRRKNVVAAAAVSGPNMSIRDSSSDPWGSAADSLGSSGEDPLVESPSDGLCVCKSFRRPRGPSKFGADDNVLSPRRKMSTGNRLDATTTNQNNTCVVCGKKCVDAAGLAWFNPTRMHRLQSMKALSTTKDALDDPQHVRALLHCTPKLRHISAASAEAGMPGKGRFASSRNILNMILPQAADGLSSQKGGSEAGSASGFGTDYSMSLVRDRANQQAASELASLLWVLAHEMSLEDYGTVESEVFTYVFALVHDAPDKNNNEKRMAGLAALDALIDAPSADEEKKGIKFANALSNGLRAAHGDFEFLSAVSKALGRMATRTANVDFVESEVTRALEWLRTERSDRRYVGTVCFVL